MKIIVFFINSTINKKNLDINYHNIKITHNNFDEIYICDEKNDFSEELDLKTKNFRNKKDFLYFNKNNTFQKIDNVLKKVEDLKNIDSLTIILDDYIYLNNLQSYFDFAFTSSYDLISFTDSTEIFYHLQINLLTIKKFQLTFSKI